MAWRWPAQIIETGVVVDPRDFVRNQMEFVGEFNGRLDRDNVGLSEVASSDLATQALVSAGSNPQSGSPLQDIGANQSGAWVEITSMQTSVTTEDGEIIVDADVSAQWTLDFGGFGYAFGGPINYNDKWETRLLVNGIPVAHCGWTHVARVTTLQAMTGSAPVMKGSTTIQVQIRAWSDPWTNLSQINNGTSTNNSTTGTSADNPGHTTTPLSVLAGNVVWIHRKR